MAQADWAAALPLALKRMAARWPDLRLASVFFGGGTPSLMPPDLVADLLATARRLWPAEPGLEVTLEANPTSAEAARFDAFALAGVTRLSLGIQSLRDPALRFLGRRHTGGEALAAYRRARAVFASVSIDLIYALPGQTAAQWRTELAEALTLAPDHLSAYQLTIEPGTAFAHQVARARWTPTDPDCAAALFDLTQDVTAAAGLPAYEVSNHARPGHASRHNGGYWDGRPYLGLGPGAHGRVRDGGMWLATEGLRRPADWLADVAEGGLGLAPIHPLSDADRAVERLLLGLRRSDGLARDPLLDQAIDPDALAELAEDRLIEAGPDRLRIPPAARLLTDAVLARLVR